MSQRSRLLAATVIAVALAITAARPARADETDAFFAAGTVREIRLTFDDPDWYNALYASHASDPDDPYFPARFEYGEVVLDPVGVRFKGNSSFGIRGVKKSFKIDFNEYDEGGDGAASEPETTFLGLKKLNLNNGFKDPTMLREKLFFDLAGTFGPALRAVHTRVYVNDAYWGLYLAVEQPDQTFIEGRFGDDEDGNLYEGEFVGGAIVQGHQADLTYLGPDRIAG